MTRQFFMRAAAAAMPLTLGLAALWGNNSVYDKFIEGFSVFEVSVVLAGLIAFFGALMLWVCAAIRPSRWPAKAKHRVTKSVATIALVTAACIGGQRAEAFVMQLPPAPSTAVQIDQPFTLPADEQRQVDSAIEKVSKDARDNPGFVMSMEMAFGIFVAAVLLGTVLIIVVRAVCKSLDRMRDSIRTQMGKIKTFLENPTNPPVIIGAGLFNHRTATTNDLPSGMEFNLSFMASAEPAVLTGTVPGGETVSLADFLNGFGPFTNWPADSVVGQGVTRTATGYSVAPAGFTNLVTLGFESATNLTQGSWQRVLNLTVPAGALIDFADLTGESEGTYWRIHNIAQ